MATTCPSFLRGTVMRVTRLDACGRPIYGEGNQIVSDGFVTATLSAEVQEGESITVTKANGKVCVNEASDDQLNWYTSEIEFCSVDPDLIQIMNPGWDKVLDADGNVIGYNANGTLSGETGFALEIWMDTYGASDACSGETAQGAWGYILLPWMKGGAPGDIEIGNDAISFTFNARTKTGSRWGRGPYPVQLQQNGVPGPLLQPIGEDTHYRLFTTTLRPPEPECGAIAVDRPTPEVSDLTVSGVPGEDPRRTVRLRADNHGFGPVTIDWGDGTPETTAGDGSYVIHTYAADGEYTITVRDQETPAVVSTREITVPLPADEPLVSLSATDAGNRYVVTAQVTLPEQSSGQATIDWGDGGDVQDITAGADGTVTVSHTYTASGVYSVTVRRADITSYRARTAVAVPVQTDPTASVAEDPADATAKTAKVMWDNGANGPVSIDWGDGSALQDGVASGSATHPYAANGSHTATVISKANTAARKEVTFTIPFP